MTTKGQRKVRSDKKMDLKPTLTIELKDAIYRLSYVTNTLVKDVSAHLCAVAIDSVEIMKSIAKHFQRDIRK
ncbi:MULTISPECIES: hypothetical protein [Lysinibacillus]|uniref:hypothetical protein n=1 Tax=Lysinibacillus TaxID=400634 RepID=UPI000D381D21|nr:MULTISPECIES: hypothetical protein [Lysinibacillus]MED4888435.1 hypothetical protein [Lysinibacillus fusiformis]